MVCCFVRSWCAALLALAATGCGAGSASSSPAPVPPALANAEKSPPGEPTAESRPPAKLDPAAAEKDAVAALKKHEAAMETNDQGQVVGVRLSEAAVPGGFERLAELPALRKLTLAGTGLTDEQLAHLPTLPSLEKLDLSWTQVSGEALKHLASFEKLRDLNLAYTTIADSQLADLEALAHLKAVLLEGTDVSEAGVVGRFKRVDSRHSSIWDRFSRVERWRGALGAAYQLPALSSAGASLNSLARSWER